MRSKKDAWDIRPNVSSPTHLSVRAFFMSDRSRACDPKIK